MVARVDGVGGAELAGFGEFKVVEVGGDDGVGAGEVGAEDSPEADAATADDDHRFADLDLGVVVDDAEAGGEGVGEEGADFEIGCLGNGGDAVLRKDGVPLEGGDAAGVHGAAIPGVKGATGFDATTGTPVAHDAVAGFDVADLGAGFEDGSTGFVSEKVGEPAIGTFDAVDFPDL